MLKTTATLRQELTGYANPDMKIHRMVAAGELLRIRPGWYETDPGAEPAELASIVHRPSYVSFEYALSYHGLIPERVEAITCATYDQRKRTSFSNAFGTYTYQSVPRDAYPIGLFSPSWNYGGLMARPEKALCDQLYKMPPATSARSLRQLLFDSLRIEEADLLDLDKTLLTNIAMHYKKRNLRYLRETLEELS